MERSAEVYARLIADVRETMPDVADQIELAIAEGHRVEVGKLPTQDRVDLNARLDPKFARVSKDDLIALPYSDDERLRILLRALETLSRSMAANRDAVASFLQQRDAQMDLLFRGDDAQIQEVRLHVARTAPGNGLRFAEAQRLIDEAESELA